MMPGKRLVVWSLWLLVGLAAIAPAAAQETGGRICVTAYHDSNQNGMRDTIEPLLADVVVSLLNEQNIVIASYVTDGQTEPHCFSDLGAGTYLVNFAGGLAEPTREETFVLTLVSGQVVPAQAQYGAVPVDPAALAAGGIAPATAQGPVDFTTARLVLALGGAAMAVMVMAALGFIVYQFRYRR